MGKRYTRGYYLRGFTAIAIAAIVAVATDIPGQTGEFRGLVYFVFFGITLAGFESLARRRGWSSRIES